MSDFEEVRRRSENHACLHCGVGDEMLAEIGRLRAALELIAGATTDKLQAIQARNALDNIGPSQQKAQTP